MSRPCADRGVLRRAGSRCRCRWTSTASSGAVGHRLRARTWGQHVRPSRQKSEGLPARAHPERDAKPSRTLPSEAIESCRSRDHRRASPLSSGGRVRLTRRLRPIGSANPLPTYRSAAVGVTPRGHPDPETEEGRPTKPSRRGPAASPGDVSHALAGSDDDPSSAAQLRINSGSGLRYLRPRPRGAPG
jgi:hypothetical protein